MSDQEAFELFNVFILDRKNGKTNQSFLNSLFDNLSESDKTKVMKYFTYICL